MIEQARQQRIAQTRSDHPETTRHMGDTDVLRFLKLGRQQPLAQQ